MTTSVWLLDLSVLAALLAVALGPRLNRDRKVEQVLAAVRRRPPQQFLRTRVALLVLSAGLLVMAVGQR